MNSPSSTSKAVFTSSKSLRKRCPSPKTNAAGSGMYKTLCWWLIAFTLTFQILALCLFIQQSNIKQLQNGVDSNTKSQQVYTTNTIHATEIRQRSEYHSPRLRVYHNPTLPIQNGPVRGKETSQEKNPASSDFSTTTFKDKPITIRFRDNMQRHHLEDVPCDVPCRVWPAGSATTKNPATVDGTDYGFSIYSMEGPVVYPFLQVPESAARSAEPNKLYATTSFQSDIPLSYYSSDLFNIQAPAVDFDSAIKGASFIAKNCNSYSHRERIVQELIEASNTTIRIDSLSSCLKNANPPEGVVNGMKNKTEIMQKYLFHLSFENQIYDDYITEKLWGALESGTLPVYLGAQNIREHIPQNSVILVDDFESTSDLARYLAEVSQNRTLYESYHTWRKQPLPQHFRQKYDFTKVHSYCRMCRLVYAKINELEWDKESQEIVGIKFEKS